MEEIWSSSKAYLQAKQYIDWCTRSSYNKLTVNGYENVPKDAPVIFIGNHSNTLMDAMLVLQAVDGPCAFGARADIFRNPKAAAFLHFLRIVPLARERDGLSAVAGNLAVFDKVVECLAHGVPFCMFPEGTHRTKHSLLPFKKGAFRIALQAAQKIGGTVYIVPVGIDLEDYFHFRKNAVMNFGEAIPVTADSDINELRKISFERLSKLFTYFPDDENYDASWAAYSDSVRKKVSSTDRLLLLPAVILMIAMLAFCWPMVLVSWILCRRLKDKAWANTMRFASKVVMLPLCMVISAISLLFTAGGIFSWMLGLAFSVIAMALSYSCFYDMLNYIRFVRGGER